MNLHSAYALVTGGSRGIGRAICLELARSGVSVAIKYARGAAAAEEVAALCRSMSVNSFAIQTDVADATACGKMVEDVLSRFGRLDILVNNAGVNRDSTAHKMTDEAWDTVLNTNLKGAFSCIRAALPSMTAQRSGRIINITSISGLHGNFGQANYSASKAGLIGLTKTLAKEVARYGITVNAVAPGFTETDMTAAVPEKVKERLLSAVPLGFAGQPEDIARPVVFLAGEGGRFITGQVLCVDGGETM